MQFLGIPNLQKNYQNGQITCNTDHPETCFFEADDDEAKRLNIDFPKVFKMLKKGEYETKVAGIAIEKQQRSLATPEPEVGDATESTDEVPAIEKDIPVPDNTNEDVSDGELPSMGWTVARLKDYMDKKDVPYDNSMNKAQLLKCIENF